MRKHHGALLVLDEAHSVLSPPFEERDDPSSGKPVVLRVGTLSKTLGALGGFVAGPRRYTDLLVNRARAYIFTTASSPADAAAALAALRALRSPEGDAPASPGCAPTSTVCARATRRRSSPTCVAARRARSKRPTRSRRVASW